MTNARKSTRPEAGSSNKHCNWASVVLPLLFLLQAGSSNGFIFSPLHHHKQSRGSFQQLNAGPTQQQLGLLSFDLDDTLFHTSEVVRAANEVMIQVIQDRGCQDATIPDFLDNTRSIRKTLDAPITYRDLRKLAIRKTFELSTTFSGRKTDDDDIMFMDALVNDCYDAWVNERHAAAERFVFSDAVETLQQLRSLYPDACFAAITNGAGDPFMMPNTLAPYFDFRISGEDQEVFPHRKPHPFIYEYALTKYEESSSSSSSGAVLAASGLLWCHVGDCLANDVGASAACGAQAIWMCLEDDEDAAAARLTDNKKFPEWSTATNKEVEKRAAQVQEGRKAVTAKIHTLSELPDAISLLLETSRVLN